MFAMLLIILVHLCFNENHLISVFFFPYATLTNNYLLRLLYMLNLRKYVDNSARRDREADIPVIALK